MDDEASKVAGLRDTAVQGETLTVATERMPLGVEWLDGETKNPRDS